MRKDSFLRLKQHGVQRVPANWTQCRVKYLGAYINGYPFKPKDWGTVGRPILRIPGSQFCEPRTQSLRR